MRLNLSSQVGKDATFEFSYFFFHIENMFQDNMIATKKYFVIPII